MGYIFFSSSIISLLLIYIAGNLHKVLRNFVCFSYYLFSFIYFLSIDSSILTLKLFGIESLDLLFQKTDFSLPFLVINHIIFFFIFLRETIRKPRESESSYYMNINLVFVLLNLIFVSSNLITVYIFYELFSLVLVIMITINLNELKNSETILFINLLGSFILLSIIVIITAKKIFLNYPSIFYIILYISVSLRSFILPISGFFKREISKADFNFLSIVTLSIFLSGFFIMLFLYKIFLSNETVLPLYSKFFLYLFLLLTFLHFSFESIIVNNLKRILLNLYGVLFSFNLLIFLYISNFTFSFLLNNLTFFIPITLLFIFFDFIEEDFGISEISFIGNLLKIKPVISIGIVSAFLSLTFLFPSFGFHLFKNVLFDLSFNSFPLFLPFILYQFFIFILILKIFYYLFLEKNQTSLVKKIDKKEILLSILYVPFIILLNFTEIFLFVYSVEPIIFFIIFFLSFIIFLLIFLKIDEKSFHIDLKTNNNSEYIFLQNRKSSSIGDRVNPDDFIFNGEKKIVNLSKKFDISTFFTFLKDILDNLSRTTLKLYQRSFTASLFIFFIFFIIFLFYFLNRINL